MKSSQVPRVPLQSSIVKFVALFNLIQEGSEQSTVQSQCGIIWNYNFITLPGLAEQRGELSVQPLTRPSLPSFSGYQLNY